MRVLLIAPTCDGEDVGEAWVAHQWASRLSERHEVTLLTYAKRGARPVAQQVPRARVVEWSEPRLLSRFERLNSMLKPGYVPFYARARSWLRREIARGVQYDVVFQPTPVAMRYPSPAAGLGLPLIIGPIGGALETPPAFRTEETAPWYTRLRRLDTLRFRYDPLLRRTYGGASMLLGIAPYVEESLGSIPLRRFEVMSDTGLDAMPPAPGPRAGGSPVRLLFVGRLVRTKGARDAIAALAHLSDLPVRLDLVGDGFDRDACERLVEQLGLGGRVSFHGQVTKAEVASFYAAADIFVFPSYREAGGSVVYEALGAGLPLVVCDRGGPAATVDQRCARTVTPVNPVQYAEDLASALRPLVLDPVLRGEMGRAARARLQDVGLWEQKVLTWEALVTGLR
jgi:glycosyltransferase involved in cell wall biosynthesis